MDEFIVTQQMKILANVNTCRENGISGSKECCKEVAACFQETLRDWNELQRAITYSKDKSARKICRKINEAFDCMDEELNECEANPRTVVGSRFAGSVNTMKIMVSQHCEGTEQFTGSTTTYTKLTTSLDWQSSSTAAHPEPTTPSGFSHSSDNQTSGRNLTYAVAGACFGAVIAIAIVAGILILLRIKRRQKSTKEKTDVADAVKVEDEETYTEINESCMSAVYNNRHEERNTALPRSFVNLTPYEEVETIVGHQDKNDEIRYDHSVENVPVNRENPPSGAYETLDKASQELSLKTDYTAINCEAPTKTGMIGEIDYTGSKPTEYRESENEIMSITKFDTLETDAHGYLAPQGSHTYFVLERQNDS